MERKKHEASKLPDPGYLHVKDAFAGGRIKQFDEIFVYIKKMVVAKDIGLTVDGFTKKMQDPGLFDLEEVSQMSKLFQIPYLQFLNLIGEKVMLIRNRLTPQELRQREGAFILKMHEQNVDLPSLAADIKRIASRCNNTIRQHRRRGDQQ